ncbi:MAG: hypothetical protein D8M59_16645 [Planctomycetes bacterium]|nr:hypothetical protein [Planctomycetota bacterium]
MLTALFMAWSNAHTLADRFAVARDALTALDASFGNVGITYRGFIKSLAGVSDRLVALLVAQLRNHLCRQPNWRLGRWVPLAVDGSKFDLPRTADNRAGFGIGAHEQTAPQAMVTMLWHLGIGLPWDWRIGRATASERHQLRAMIHDTPP